MNDKDIIQRAEKAEALLNDKVLKGAFQGIRETLLQQFEDAPIRDRDGVHEIKLMLKLLGAVENALETYVNDGKITEVKIEHEKKLKHLK